MPPECSWRFVLLAGIAITSGAARGGPLLLGGENPTDRLLMAQLYVGVTAITGLLLAAIHAEGQSSKNALRRNQAMLSRTERIARVGSWEWEVATDTVTWSDEMFRIFQRNPAEGAPSFAEHPELYHAEDMRRLKVAVEAAISNGTAYELELRVIRKDGETRLCLARGHAEMGPGKSASRLFGSFQNITEHQALEARFQQAQKMESVGQLAGGVAHDFNNILSAIMMQLSFLRRNPNLDAETRELLEEVLTGAKRFEGNLEVQPGPFVCLSVADTGCGMDEATLKRVFEPFFTTKEPGKGTGLGLATVYGIAAQHKGWVEAVSEPGKDTTFSVFLPATTKGIAEPAPTRPVAPIRGHETILLVEDEAILRRMLTQVLRGHGYRVLEADNGHTAMRLWREHPGQIALLFSDMVMPEGMTGWDLADKLKAEKPNLKVIISSDYNAQTAYHGRPTAGGITYLQKPYEAEVLSKTIRDCLERD